MNRKSKVLLFLGILLLLALGFGFSSYTRMTRISGSTRADLEKELQSRFGQPHEAVSCGEFTSGAGILTLWAEQSFPPIENSRLVWWNDSLPDTDCNGTPLQKNRFYNAIDVQVKERYFFTLNNDPLPDGEWTFFFHCTGYDDNDLNSTVRAVLGQQEYITAEPPSKPFLDSLTMLQSVQPDLSGLLMQAKSFIEG